MGWIYENDLNENNKAMEIYQKLLNNYPDTDYAKKVKKKIEEVDKQQKLAEKSEAPSDTSLVASQRLADKQTESEDKKVNEVDDLMKMNKENYRELLKRELDKDSSRLRNPKRIIK